MRIIDAEALAEVLRSDYDAHREDGDNITMYDISYTLGEILEMVDSVPTITFQIGNNAVELEVEDDY